MVLRQKLGPKQQYPVVGAFGGSLDRIAVPRFGSSAELEAEVQVKKPHEFHLENFFDAIRHGVPLNCPAEMGYETAVAVLTVNKAVEAGRKIDFSPEEGGLIKSLFSSSDPKTLPEKLARKIDELFEKVQEILGMRKKMRKVRINLYSNSEQLGIAYQRLFKKDCGVRSWYLYEFKTIYCNVSDLRAGMLAHEMAHHIIDHYLVIRPPRSTAEILARYVDKHLNDSVKRY